MTAVVSAQDGLVHPAFNIIAEFREARHMDEERLRLELALKTEKNKKKRTVRKKRTVTFLNNIFNQIF